MVMVLGVDVHKDTHTTVAVDQTGRQHALCTVQATDAGHEQLVAWARRKYPCERKWAVEDCRHVSIRLERALLAAGETVVRVPPKLMADARNGARTRGKSDPIDALAVARAVLREPDLPTAVHDEVSRELKLLVDHRENLLGERTRMINRLRWHLHELDPELELPARSLGRLGHLDWLAAWLVEQPPTTVTRLVTRLATELVVDIRGLSVRINALEREIAQRMERVSAAAAGTARLRGTDRGEDRRGDRHHHPFRSEACFAMHAGVAPIPASSGRTQRHRLARGGNRQLNAALHRIALTQVGMPGSLGHTYYQRRRTTEDTSKEALRVLKRRLARVVYSRLTNTATLTADGLPTAA